MRAGLYARVSTHDQQTLPMQLAAMRDFAQKRGWEISLEVQDIGSGAALRQKRVELLAAAKMRAIDLIVVWRLDRWGRSLVDLVNTLQEIYNRTGEETCNPCELLLDKVRAGELGRKSGRGFYTYDEV